MSPVARNVVSPPHFGRQSALQSSPGIGDEPAAPRRQCRTTKHACRRPPPSLGSPRFLRRAGQIPWTYLTDAGTLSPGLRLEVGDEVGNFLVAVCSGLC